MAKNTTHKSSTNSVKEKPIGNKWLMSLVLVVQIGGFCIAYKYVEDGDFVLAIIGTVMAIVGKLLEKAKWRYLGKLDYLNWFFLAIGWIYWFASKTK